MGDQRVRQCHHAGIEGAPRGAQRLVGLQHNGELGQVETAHENQCARTKLGGVGLGMSERIADLAQRYQPEPWGQVERGGKWHIQTCFERHLEPDWRFQFRIIIT